MNAALAEKLRSPQARAAQATRRPVVLRPGERALQRDPSEERLFRNAAGESFWYRIVGEGEACLTGYGSSIPEAVIPERIGGYAVVAFGSGSFSDLSALERVACPTTLRHIEDYAFSRCPHLESIELDEGLESIGHTAFYLCNRLAGISVPSTVRHIGNSPFGESMRGHVARLGNLEIPASNPYLRVDDAGALYERCGAGWKLVDASAVEVPEYELAEGTVEVGESAFLGNLRVRSLQLPSGLVAIGRDAFRACSHLTSVELPDTLERIETGAFSCSGVRALSMPASCTRLEEDALCTGPVFKGSVGRGYSSALTRIEVASANPAYRACQGALFARGADGVPDELLLVPRNPDELDLTGIRRAAPTAFAGTECIGRLVVDERLSGYAAPHFSCERLRVAFSRPRDGVGEIELELPGGKMGNELVSCLFSRDGIDAPGFLAAYDEALAGLMAGSERDKVEAARLMAGRCASPCLLGDEHVRAFRGFLSANIESVCAHFGAVGHWEGFDQLSAAGLLHEGNARGVADALARCCGSLAVAYVLQLQRTAPQTAASAGTLESRIEDAYAL